MLKHLLIFFFALVIQMGLATQTAFAQIPTPRIPCNQTNETYGYPFEFHDLRPYQKSPCDQTLHDIALFCGHNFIVPDEIVIKKVFGSPLTNWKYMFEGSEISPVSPANEFGDRACFFCDGGTCRAASGGAPGCDDTLSQCEVGGGCVGECTNNGNGTESCTFEVEREKKVLVQWKSEFPIMGNTDDAINFGNYEKIIADTNTMGDLNTIRVPDEYVEPLDVYDPTKINEYVSWYLNGTIFRAEYPALDANEDADVRKIVDYSGPIRKLLSFYSQIEDRTQTVHWANRSRKLTKEQEEQIGLLNLENNNLIDPWSYLYRHDQIVACKGEEGCYPLNGGVRIGQNLRISDFVPLHPPLLYASGGILNYDRWEDYWDALTAWYGRTLSPFWNYIPFSSTEDRQGRYYFNEGRITASASGSATVVRVILFEIFQIPSKLFFAHTLEVEKLGSILQNTFAFKGAALAGKPADILGPNNPYCELLEVRSNPGDALFPTTLSATLHYILQIDCDFYLPYPIEGAPVGNLCRNVAGAECMTIPAGYCCEKNYGPADCGGNDCAADCRPAIEFPGGICPGKDSMPDDECIANVLINLGTIVETPLVDKIWSRLVSGPAGIFRKFFPKIEPNNPVYGIMDLPAEANFDVISLNGGIQLKGSQTGTGHKIYFPHVGGIHQYFLKCIQTALRPRGLGEFCKREPGQEGSIEECFGVAETAVPTQYLAMKENFISMADRWSSKCPGDKNNYAKECYNHVVVSAMTAGVNPALALTIWLNESGASNYCEGGASTKDFGIYDMSIAQNYLEQLKRFLVLPFVSYYQQCQENARRANMDPMYGFLNVFLTGMCDLQRGSQTCNSAGVDTDGWSYYTCIRDCTWNWVTMGECGDVGQCGTSAGGSFGIRGADDILCP